MKLQNFISRDIVLGLFLLLFTPGLAWCQNGLAEPEPFGDLNRPADVLLGEAEAKVAKAELCKRLQEYQEIQGVLSELRAVKFGRRPGRSEPESDKPERVTLIACLEQDLKQTESEIRAVCDKLDSSWLMPVDYGPDEGKVANLMSTANHMQVTLQSKTGSLLTPTKLTLTSRTEGSFRFTQIRHGVYIANAPIGEYQLGWQLSDKSIVQRTKIDVVKNGRLTCEVTLGPPEIQVKTKWPELNISGERSTSTTSGLQSPPGPVASVTRSVPRERILDFTILWDEECLFSHDFFGLRVPSVAGETLVFYYGKPGHVPDDGAPRLSAMAVIPLRDGQIHGTVRRWSEEGTLLLEAPHRAGKLHGESRFFSRKGNLLGTSILNQGEGVYRIWDRNRDEPVLLKELSYLDGDVQPSPGNIKPAHQLEEPR